MSTSFDGDVIAHRIEIVSHIDPDGELWTSINTGDTDVPLITGLGMLEHAKHILLAEYNEED